MNSGDQSNSFMNTSLRPNSTQYNLTQQKNSAEISKPKIARNFYQSVPDKDMWSQL